MTDSRFSPLGPDSTIAQSTCTGAHLWGKCDRDNCDFEQWHLRLNGLSICVVLDVNRPKGFVPYAEWHFDRENTEETDSQFEDAVDNIHEDLMELLYGF